MAFVGRGINTVRTVGNQTAAGDKSFTGGVTLSGGAVFDTKNVSLQSNLTSSGDITVTGDMTLSGNKTFIGGYDNVIIKTPDRTTKYTDITFKDYNGYRRGYLRAIKTSDNYDNFYCAFGDFSYIIAPASATDGSVVTTVSHKNAANGYFKLGNGLIIQWGADATSTNGRTITFPTPFTTTTSYAVVVNKVYTAAEGDYTNVVGNKTTTSFKVYSNRPVNWIAIGY